MSYINIENLKVGDIVVTGDSYGYDLVEVLLEPYLKNEEGYADGYIEVKVKHVINKKEAHLGGCPQWAYCPNFWTLPSFLSMYPPERRDAMVKHLIKGKE